MPGTSPLTRFTQPSRAPVGAGERRIRSVRTGQYKQLLAGLPAGIQRKAEDLFKVFVQNPHDPMLQNEDLYDSDKGRHRIGSRSVAVTIRYRAIYVIDKGKSDKGPEQVCWYWIGSREHYANFIGCR